MVHIVTKNNQKGLQDMGKDLVNHERSRKERLSVEKEQSPVELVKGRLNVGTCRRKPIALRTAQKGLQGTALGQSP